MAGRKRRLRASPGDEREPYLQMWLALTPAQRLRRSWRLRTLAILVCVGLGCGGGDDADLDAAPVLPDAGSFDAPLPDAAPRYTAAEAFSISEESPGRDEDPHVLAARDGSVFAIWFSDRTGGVDIYLRHSLDGAAWDDPVAVTTGAATDYYPTLLEDDDGFHASWFRRAGAAAGHVYIKHTTDPADWSAATEIEVTVPGAGEADWTPSLARAASGRLVIAFARDACYPNPQPCFSLWVSASDDNGASWATPAPMVDPAGEQDFLPYLATKDGTVVAVWNRYAATATLPYFTASSDIATAESTDGLSWSSVVQITNDVGDDESDVIPMLHPNHDGLWRVLWLHSGVSARVVEQVYGSGFGATALDALPSAGYSHHVAPTVTPGVEIGVWVQPTPITGDLEIWARVFRR